MTHHASPGFWRRYDALPDTIRALADKSFELLKADSRHPSLHLKRVGRYWSVRVGLRYRALGTEVADGVLWIWIGTHADYDARSVNWRSRSAFSNFLTWPLIVSTQVASEWKFPRVDAAPRPTWNSTAHE